MALKAVAIALLVPPTSLLWVALIGLLLERRYRRAGAVLAWTGLLGVMILGMPALGVTMLVGLEQDLPLTPRPDAPPQAIVILGGDVNRGGGQQTVFDPGPLSLERERAGAILFRHTGLPILVTGGVLRPSEPAVATLMADSLTNDFGVPVRWRETVSRDTWENAHLTAEILHREGIKSIYLVTHAWHMRRALIAFADTGIVVTAAPTRFDRAPTPWPSDFLPEVGGWRASYFALHEWVGCAYYALR